MTTLIELQHPGDTVWTAGPTGELRGWRCTEDGGLVEVPQAYDELRQVAQL